MSLSARLQRLLSAPALSLLAAAFLVVALAGSNKVTPVATLPDGVPLQLFHPTIGAGDNADRQRTAAMFILLGAVHAFTALLSTVTGLLSVSERRAIVPTLAVVTAQLAGACALFDWTAVVDTVDATVATGTILTTIAAGLAVLAALVHQLDARSSPPLPTIVLKSFDGDESTLWGGDEHMSDVYSRKG